MSYWDERYASDDTIFDWYQDFSALKPHLAPYLKFSDDFEILVPGCGNSSKKQYIPFNFMYCIYFRTQLMSILRINERTTL